MYIIYHFSILIANKNLMYCNKEEFSCKIIFLKKNNKTRNYIEPIIFK